MNLKCMVHETGERHLTELERACRYVLDFRSHGKRYREMAGESRQAAENYKTRRRAEILEGRFAAARPESRTTWDEIMGDYLNVLEIEAKSRPRRKGETSWAVQVGYAVRFLAPWFSGRKLADITSSDFLRFIDDRLSGRRPQKAEAVGTKSGRRRKLAPVKRSAVNRQLAMMRRAWRLAIETGKATTSPVPKASRKGEVSRDRVLTPEEAKRLLAVCPESIRPVVVTALLTGMRMGEILRLEWQHVNLDVPDALRRQGISGFLTIARSKNGRPRKVAISAPLATELRDLAVRNGSRYGAQVFCGTGDGLTRPAVDNRFRRAKGKAQLEDFHFHDLRHCAGTFMALQNIPLPIISSILGHRSLEMTLRYITISPDNQSPAMRVLAEAFQEMQNTALLAPESAPTGHKADRVAVGVA